MNASCKVGIISSISLFIILKFWLRIFFTILMYSFLFSLEFYLFSGFSSIFSSLTISPSFSDISSIISSFWLSNLSSMISSDYFGPSSLPNNLLIHSLVIETNDLLSAGNSSKDTVKIVSLVKALINAIKVSFDASFRRVSLAFSNVLRIRPSLASSMQIHCTFYLNP